VQSAGRRDFTDARDAAQAIWRVIEQPASSGQRIYNIPTGVGTTFRVLAEQIVAISGSRSAIEERITEPPGRDPGGVADIRTRSARSWLRAVCRFARGTRKYLEWLRHGSV